MYRFAPLSLSISSIFYFSLYLNKPSTICLFTQYRNILAFTSLSLPISKNILFLSIYLSLMGNYVSCTLLTKNTGGGGGKHSTNCAKIVLPNGEIRQIDGPFITQAAEIMFETPNYFLVNSKSLHIGKRFSPLNADEDLEMGNVYILFPMKRVNSFVTASDMGALMLLTANSSSSSSYAKKKKSSSGIINGKGRRISPDESPEDDSKWVVMNLNEDLGSNKINWIKEETPKLNLDDIEDFMAPEFQHRISMSRSKKPLLPTITEESVPIFSR